MGELPFCQNRLRQRAVTIAEARTAVRALSDVRTACVSGRSAYSPRLQPGGQRADPISDAASRLPAIDSVLEPRHKRRGYARPLSTAGLCTNEGSPSLSSTFFTTRPLG